MTVAKARAHANIALVKYWGKRDPSLNLPETGSLSLTLDALATETQISFEKEITQDVVFINNTKLSESETQRFSKFLDLFRKETKNKQRARISSHNNFPTASGLASSSSGFAALAKATSHALGMSLDDTQLSRLARQGSGSAARSIFGGFAEMQRGQNDDGSDCYAKTVKSNIDDLSMVICIVAGGQKKKIPSRWAMTQCKSTSPFYKSWIQQTLLDLSAAKKSLLRNDFVSLGHLVESNAMAMHATAMASRPPIVFFIPETLALLTFVRQLREQGVSAFATMDAGPHIKILCKKHSATSIANDIQYQFKKVQVLVAQPGPGAHII